MHRTVIPPICDRMFEEKRSKNDWLFSYMQFRATVNHKKDLKPIICDFLGKIGKNNSELAFRFRGCLLGLAIGDAMGTTLEFQKRNEEETHRTILGKGPFNLKPGEWTDDTSMALCLAHSLYEESGFNPEHQMKLYTSWWKDGFMSSNGHCFDIGNTVQDALRRFDATGDAYAGSTDEFSAGNGALMRLAPIVLFFASSPDMMLKMAALSSKTTHGNEKSMDACRYFAGLIYGALKGVDKDTLLSDKYCPVENFWENYPMNMEIEEISLGSYKNKHRDEIKSTGYVVDSLEAALWAFYNSNSFEEGLIRAVNLGGDADTIGAIYGQLAGAYYGEPAIDFKLIKAIKYFHYFYFFADEFVGYYTGSSDLVALLKDYDE